MARLSGLKQGLEHARHLVNNGWEQLIERTSGALTRFSPSHRDADTEKPATRDDATGVTLETAPATSGWGLLAGDLFEDDEALVLRLEIPGLKREDFDLEVRDGVLIVRGEKRLEEQRSEGRYRVRQCTYGRFSRTFPLPTKVDADKADARYTNGVLHVTLPKRIPSGRRRIELQP